MKRRFEEHARLMRERNMPKSKRKQHVHKYERINLSASERRPYDVYKCRLPGCTHYLPATICEGRLSLCHGNCGNAVMMDHQMVIVDKLVKPMCDSCRELRKKQREFLKSIPMEETA